MSAEGGDPCDEDLQFARDMQLAYELQEKEDKRAERRRKKEEKHNSTLEDGFSPAKLSADHMLFVSCTVESSRQVHLLVDTGASASAMSTNMVYQLGLETKLNQEIVGAAKGVGSSNIVGVVENVECIIGHVEFRLFFMVLEGQMPYAILGLDQMRRFKCQVDLDEDVLVFGGKDGVKEPFLPQQEAMVVAQNWMCMEQEQEELAPNSSAQPKGKTSSLLK
eukprot:CAMPEP_0117031446 /NCGR_PEP_ID=MMETSP0472-20121206/22598_1 /TAXON_ID=693140 ORGANISM="Tiarina fusus, Strain LIS" /NCGR_SAMPLE_ID=MMETSP0472 /ASSEMBLY_ACC=CAM_ASM_000603 /LENGTH=220 /DNA_ID=CAMNT_0004739767 /DNA_START=186 /DNA_END=845 /DNA_ORIENTATION=+